MSTRPNDVPPNVDDLAQDAIKRAKLAISHGLHWDAYAEPDIALVKLGLPRRKPVPETKNFHRVVRFKRKGGDGYGR